MPELAIDRFRAKLLRPDLEARAQEIAAPLRPWASDLMLGYLEQSVALALARPWWRSRDRLRVDLRVVELVRNRRA